MCSDPERGQPSSTDDSQLSVPKGGGSTHGNVVALTDTSMGRGHSL